MHQRLHGYGQVPVPETQQRDFAVSRTIGLAINGNTSNEYSFLPRIYLVFFRGVLGNAGAFKKLRMIPLHLLLPPGGPRQCSQQPGA
jgi:hypothetical protein